MIRNESATGESAAESVEPVTFARKNLSSDQRWRPDFDLTGPVFSHCMLNKRNLRRAKVSKEKKRKKKKKKKRKRKRKRRRQCNIFNSGAEGRGQCGILATSASQIKDKNR